MQRTVGRRRGLLQHWVGHAAPAEGLATACDAPTRGAGEWGGAGARRGAENRMCNRAGVAKGGTATAGRLWSGVALQIRVGRHHLERGERGGGERQHGGVTLQLRVHMWVDLAQLRIGRAAAAR